MELSVGETAATSRVQIRELDDSRLEQAVRLWGTGEEADVESPFSLAEVLAAGPARQPALVAQVGEEVVGAVAARVDGQRAWVLRWSVAAEARGRHRVRSQEGCPGRVRAIAGGHPQPGHHSGLRGRHYRSAPVDQCRHGP